MRVLLAGESWVTHSVHVKGVDSFNTSTYVEGADRLRETLDAANLKVDYLPGRLVPARFPGSAAEVLARCGTDPLLTVGTHGAGRSAAFASDCAPHWCPPDFMAWPGYDRLWANLLR